MQEQFNNAIKDSFLLIFQQFIEIAEKCLPYALKITFIIFIIELVVKWFSNTIDTMAFSSAYSDVVAEQEEIERLRDESIDNLYDNMPDEWFDGKSFSYSDIDNEDYELDVSEYEGMVFHENVSEDELDITDYSNYDEELENC